LRQYSDKRSLAERHITVTAECNHPPVFPTLRRCLLACTLLALASVSHGAARSESEAIDAIRREATAPASASSHPLPLAAHWNAGTRAMGFGPDFQIDAIQHGHYLLPWFRLEPPERSLPGSYYDHGIAYFAEHGLPLSFESPQWEMLLPKLSSAYPRPARDAKPLPISPFGPLEPWYQVGRAWAASPVLKRLQQAYPSPPLILFISNNEYPKLKESDLKDAPEIRSLPARDPFAARKVIADAWVRRYREMLRGFRDGLTSRWRDAAKFVGYDAFSAYDIGRWPGWPAYSLYTPGRMTVWSEAWDGASVSMYVHDWAPDTDFIVRSPQVEAMNRVPVLADIVHNRPQFWFEISVWDGQQPGSKSDKWLFYRALGQDFDAPRFGGMVQFGMWLLRPRVVREFRNPEHDRIRFGSYFDATMAAVARVHDQPDLERFWRAGRLLPNSSSLHPYQAALPADFAAKPRWFLLDTPQNPPRPWQLDTPLKVFALALELGTAPRREWLVYAFSPLDQQLQAAVHIPGGPSQTILSTRAGCFSLMTEQSKTISRIGC